MPSRNQISLAVSVDNVQEEGVDACRTEFSFQVCSLSCLSSEGRTVLEASRVESVDLYA
jgi:hypothetical protein